MDRFILLCVLNIANWSLSGYGAGYNLFAQIIFLILAVCLLVIYLYFRVLSYQHYDFATFLLAIFILNVWIYTIFYMIMKLRYKERYQILIQFLLFVYLNINLFTFSFQNWSPTCHLFIDIFIYMDCVCLFFFQQIRCVYIY